MGNNKAGNTANNDGSTHRSHSNIIRQFENREIRSLWDPEKEEWFFSIVDVVGALTDSENPAVYWRVLKRRLLAEGNETVTKCNGLKMRAADGKIRKTDVATIEQLLRLIQSIPSKKAEPFKQWLAKVGAERVEETIDPEIAIQRGMETYAKRGYSDGWIRQRLLSIDIRKDLTHEWQERGVRRGSEFALLTDEISRARSVSLSSLR